MWQIGDRFVWLQWVGRSLHFISVEVGEICTEHGGGEVELRT